MLTCEVKDSGLLRDVSSLDRAVRWPQFASRPLLHQASLVSQWRTLVVTNSTGGGIIYFDAGASAEKHSRRENGAETLQGSFFVSLPLCHVLHWTTFVCLCEVKMNYLSSHESRTMAVVRDWLPSVSMRFLGYKWNTSAPFPSPLPRNRVIRTESLYSVLCNHLSLICSYFASCLLDSYISFQPSICRYSLSICSPLPFLFSLFMFWFHLIADHSGRAF
jgi:hypothetical protein